MTAAEAVAVLALSAVEGPLLLRDRHPPEA